METTRLTSKGQLVIPKTIRERLRVAAGTEFTVSASGQRIVLEAVRRKGHRLSDWAGFKHSVKTLSDKEAFAPVELDRRA
ncbi:MAG: AbrB/MazE/SpoVT family DNA-binding domain-containing protein [Gammaproteobacteria bacterium]